jgi:hypothetical protein
MDEFWKPIGAGPACNFHSPRTLIVTLEFSVLRRGRSTFVVGAHLLLLAEKVQLPWPIILKCADPSFERPFNLKPNESGDDVLFVCRSSIHTGALSAARHPK